MFLVGIHAVITTPERERCIIGILKSKIPCIGYTFQEISILIEPNTVGQISDTVLLANLFECLLILRSQGSLVDTGLPAKITLMVFLKSLHPLRTLHINRFFRLHPKSLHCPILNRTFQLDPVNPKSGWCTMSIFSSVCMMLLDAGLKVFGHSCLNTKLLRTDD